MIKPKTKILKQTKKKTNPNLVETINFTKKNKNWLEVASVLSSPRRNRNNLNLSQLDEIEGDIIIPGKVLSQGSVTKKKKIVALNFSEKAKEKLKKGGYEFLTILEEVKKNPEMKGLKVLKRLDKEVKK